MNIFLPANPFASHHPIHDSDSDEEITARRPVKKDQPIHVPWDICAIIVKYCDARTLMQLQYVSSGFHSASIREASARLQFEDKELDPGLSPLQTLYCYDYDKCIKCGLELYKVFPSDSRLCLCCDHVDPKRRILRTDARNYFGISDCALSPLPVLIKDSNYRRGDIMSLFFIKDVKEAAFKAYGGRAGWYKMSREYEAARLKRAATGKRNKEERAAKLDGLLRSAGMNVQLAQMTLLYKKFIRNGKPRSRQGQARLVEEIRHCYFYASGGFSTPYSSVYR